MAIKPILTHPNPKLREKSVEIPEEEITGEDTKQLITDMKDTIVAYGAQGLAAVQIGVLKRLFVTVADDEDYRVYINPVLSFEYPDKAMNTEGCLSFPGVLELVKRYEEVNIEAFNEEGKKFQLSADELSAVAIQHEYDHLDGVLFIDHMSRLKKKYILKRVSKLRKQGRIE